MTEQLLHDQARRLIAFIERHPRLFVLTGAGISTESGIPDYRDHQGNWKRQPPVDHRDFIASEASRQRFWARSLVGWPLMAAAQPNGAHRALAALEQHGHIQQLVTQNVDGLHQRAGSRRVIDLHGRSDTVICLGCGERSGRDQLQRQLAKDNPAYCGHRATAAPDGDADLELDFSAFRIRDCDRCGGLLKPDVVFFGDNVPRSRVEDALAALDNSDAVLVVGSSLMVYSGFRFCRAAAAQNKPIAAINLGRTRADALLSLKLEAPAAALLTQVSGKLNVGCE